MSGIISTSHKDDFNTVMKVSDCLSIPRICISLLLSTLFLSAPASTEAGNDGNKKARTIIHMLDYMAVDYPEAVKDGKVINAKEFKEMKNFAVSIDSLYGNLGLSPDSPDYKQTAAHIDSLYQKVIAKTTSSNIAAAVRTIKQQIIEQTGLRVAPRRWPNMTRGKQIYAKQCQTCHGVDGQGDGPQAPNLNPSPTNFHDDGRMVQISPYQAYNTIQMGVEGTSMRAYTELSDLEAWSLAFYVKSMRFTNDKMQTLPDPQVDSLLQNTDLDLTAVSRYNDGQLRKMIREANLELNPERVIQSLRLYQP